MGHLLHPRWAATTCRGLKQGTVDLQGDANVYGYAGNHPSIAATRKGSPIEESAGRCCNNTNETDGGWLERERHGLCGLLDLSTGMQDAKTTHQAMKGFET